MAFEVKVGANIRYHRMKLGLSTRELAEKLGVQQPNITQMENDQRQPDLDKVVKMCRIFGITPDELLGYAKTINVDGHNIVYKEAENAEKKGLSKEQIAAAIRFATELKTQA
jgi:transcriptional regulator with XRE-family HTH domain